MSDPTRNDKQSAAPPSSVTSLTDSMRTSEAKKQAPATDTRANSSTSKGPRVERIKPRKQRDMTPDERKVMDWFFVRMQAIYRHLWSSSFDTEQMLRQAQKEWLDTFYRANLSDRDIGRGIITCKQTFEKPPTPREFLAVLPSRRPEHKIHRKKELPEPPEQAKARREAGKQRIRELKKAITQTSEGENQ